MTSWFAQQNVNGLSLRKEYGKVFVVTLSILISSVSLPVIVKKALPAKVEISFLDVGQGDAVLIRTPGGRNVLIDGGQNDVVLSRLDEHMNHFDRSLDVVIATHGDADHVTGLISVLRKYDIGHIIRSPADAETNLFGDFLSHVEEEKALVHIGIRGDVLDFGDGVKLRVLHPSKNMPRGTDTNDASVSVVLEYGEHTFLLTGDLSARYEPKLIGAHLPKGVTVFKAGHHGSKTSSGETLLGYIKPEYAIISAGKDNRYGHPHEEALERLSKHAKETLSTTDKGTITFESDGRTLEVVTQK